MTRVVLLGDPTKALGALAEAGVRAGHRRARPGRADAACRSSGSRCPRAPGSRWTPAPRTWTGWPRALRRIIEFTQAGGEINVIVAGINVGAQPYWNAEATMLMHTKGILVMTPDSAMVLTGKQSLDYSGGVSAEDNFGIGGYDRVMGPNGQAQYWAPNLAGRVRDPVAHYEHAYVAPGERVPAPRRPPTDPLDRDVATYPHVHPGQRLHHGRRDLLRRDQPRPQEAVRHPHRDACRRRPGPRRCSNAGPAWPTPTPPSCLDAHLGGYPVSLIGIESRAGRRGVASCPPTARTPGPAGTLFPRSSKKAARAINAASGNRPLVVLANLSGFDGSPESLRNLQLEYGAEIGRAIVNFDGPIVFCVISRYHGGAFVVFSKALNADMKVLAVEGSYASVHRRRAGRRGRVHRRGRHANRRTTRGSTALEDADRRSAAAPDARRLRVELGRAARHGAGREAR